MAGWLFLVLLGFIAIAYELLSLETKIGNVTKLLAASQHDHSPGKIEVTLEKIASVLENAARDRQDFLVEAGSVFEKIGNDLSGKIEELGRSLSGIEDRLKVLANSTGRIAWHFDPDLEGEE